MTAPVNPDFWSWSLETYAYDKVREHALMLQDKFDLNVNILLWCVWSATRFRAYENLVFRKAVDILNGWNTNVTANLRSARRHVHDHKDAPSDLYETLKEIELSAEKIEQALLQSLADRAGTVHQGDPGRIAIKNLTTYAALSNVQKQNGFTVSYLDDFATAALSLNTGDQQKDD